MRLGNIEAHVEVDGGPLEEYNITTTGNQITC